MNLQLLRLVFALAHHGSVINPVQAAPLTYSRHEPEKTILYRTIQDHFQTFAAQAETRAEKPPIALERMSETPDGKILYKLKTRYSDGTTHILFDPLELVEKVVALIPPPRANLLKYHGLLAPNSKVRSKIVPEKSEEKKEKTTYPGQSKWAELLKGLLRSRFYTAPTVGAK